LDGTLFLSGRVVTQVEITVLTDNTATYGYLAEWGLGLFVKVGDVRFLYDCGFTSTAVQNARLLGIDPASVDAIVLSHGHVDHTGGLRQVLAGSRGMRIFAHPAALGRKVRRTEKSTDVEIGMNLGVKELQSLGARLNLIATPHEILPSVTTSGEVPMVTSFESIDQGLYRQAAGGMVPDPLLDDLSLAIKTDLGLVVLLGCAHRGPVNILKHLQSVVGEQRIYAVVGGMHLMKSPAGRISDTVRALQAIGITKLACGHCTGFAAMARLADAFGGAFSPLASGTRLVFPSD
jgi:7,8-dihydropterin-6-yl-methyl-4-(beta-D-ribofuranosyl)aminobenzene 5'-phosphate synthase